MTARIERDALTLQLARPSGEDRIEGVVVRLDFEGALETVSLEGEGEQPGIYSFFLGKDPSKWRTDVPAYTSVLYRGLQEGVDLRVREQEGRLEYDLILAPGADLGRIVVRCDGTEGIEIEPDGSLAMKTALGPIRHSPPVTWQVLAGGERMPIEARFRQLGSDRFGFEVPGRDPSLALVIDPGLLYSTFLGGTFGGYDYPYALALDASGAATVAGLTYSGDFPATPGAYDTSFNDAFVTRLSPSGGSLLFSTFLGGAGQDYPNALAVDASGATTLAGSTASANFPTTAGAYDTTFAGPRDAFVARLSPSGGSLLYSTFLGGTGETDAYALALDSSGSASVAGTTFSIGFPTAAGAYDTSANGYYDAFVSRLSPSGGSLLYSTFLGGANLDTPYALALDASGAVTVAGRSFSSNFPTTAGAYDTSYNGGPILRSDPFVSRLSPSGGSLLYSTLLGGTENDAALALALDGSGAATLTGVTESSDYPTTVGAFDTSFGGLGDSFVTRLSPSGGSLLFSTFLGGTAEDDYARALALDGSGSATVVGSTDSPDFPTTAGAYDTSYDGGGSLYPSDAFVTRLSPSGGSLRYSTFLGGTSDSDYASALALDASGAATVAGYTASSDFPTTGGAYDTTFDTVPGSIDAFVTRLDLMPAGATPFGTSTPGCSGPLAIGVTSIPQVGNASFAITCTNAPASAFGFFGVSSAGLAAPLVFNGLAVWIDPFAPLFFEIVVPSDAVGAATVPIPIPANPGLAGFQAFFQFAWFDACAPGGFSASNALAVVVQP
ncbi:MAG: hypothetical protein L0323_03260 [Planctomycetes bacterium]|nr:hypothetical protein [Planctomycetota bacterium]